jgi:amidohydrolase
MDLTAYQPAEPNAEAKRRLAAAVQAARDEILDLSRRVHANPEPAFEEHLAAGWVAETLARHGYEVEHPAGSLGTAVRGRLRGGGGDGPRVGILAEYDALPGIGHACGHNTMAASGVGAAIALAALSADLPGEVMFLGTPAEERGSGKEIMIRDGLFDGLDAALLFHPGDINEVEAVLLASEDVDVVFTGKAAHAASEPWDGLNALDALVLLFTSIGLWRQQLHPDARVHGIVLEGGAAANVIPERTAARFMIRSSDEGRFAAMRERFGDLVRAAALATGCTGTATHSGMSRTMRHNQVLGSRFVANMAAYGLGEDPPTGNRGSSDMGNVSHVCPTIHPTIAICERGTPGHSIEFREAAASARAEDVTLLAATIVAQTAYELLSDPDVVAAAWREFHEGRP